MAKSSSSASRGSPTRASAPGASTHLPPTIRVMSRRASGPPIPRIRDQRTFSSIPIARAMASRSVVKPGDSVRSTGAMRNPPSDSLPDPDAAWVATDSVHPCCGWTKR